MASLSSASVSLVRTPTHLPCFRSNHGKVQSLNRYSKTKTTHLSINSSLRMCSIAASDSPLSTSMYELSSKKVWIWTENSQVMTAAVERGWDTFIFSSLNQGLANEWSKIALIDPLFIKEREIFDNAGERVATIFQVSTPSELKKLHPEAHHVENVVIDLLDWQVIPAENIVAEFQGSKTTVFAVSKSPAEAQLFLEALEHGLGGVVLKVEVVKAVLDLKVHAVGMGDRVCVDLCSLMRPGEGLLVGSFARGLFLVHSECLESSYIASRPFRVNAGPVHAYVATPGGKTSYLSELKAGKEVIVVDQTGKMRTAIVGRVKIETRPFILVEAKIDANDQTVYSILLQTAETVALVCPHEGNRTQKTVIPVTSLKAGDEVLLRLQGGARHTGIEIKEFIVEN
ncbi:3-dehydroquinate synthase homolog isoform X2 [Gossypium hirsutum]|uniref:3-dehydroquinate synthase homolog isoform X2 n=1 Tax=Gossypium hirsutum TaxID=3635 RepID=A0ABM3C0B7_GOSHI|nr:3-dehydroquinate synthase homolog isoform X2 [Gossypium hirsutum]